MGRHRPRHLLHHPHLFASRSRWQICGFKFQCLEILYEELLDLIYAKEIEEWCEEGRHFSVQSTASIYYYCVLFNPTPPTGAIG